MQAIADHNQNIQRYIQMNIMTPQQYADDLIANSCKVAHDYDKGTSNYVFIQGVGKPIRHSLQNIWATNPQMG